MEMPWPAPLDYAFDSERPAAGLQVDDSGRFLAACADGSVARLDSPDYAAHIGRFPDLPGARQIIFIHIESVQTSCGYAVPEMTLESERPTLVKWAEKKGPDVVRAYHRDTNKVSIDGLETGILEDIGR